MSAPAEVKAGSESADDPYALYRYFDVSDRLLYIGISGDLAIRDTTHISRSRWMQFTARSTVKRHKTLEDVKAAERLAIETEHPLFNRQYNDTPEAKERLRAYLGGLGRLDLLGPRDTSSIELIGADEGRQNFAAMLDRVHGGEHVGITRNGQPWVVVVSREWYRNAIALRNGVNAFTQDTDGHRLPGESELPVGELLRLIGDAAIDEPEELRSRRD